MTQPSYPPPSYGYAPRPSLPSASIPPNTSVPKKNTAALVIGIVAGVVILGAAGGGVAIWKLRTKRSSLPVAANVLPSQTHEVSTRLIESTREPNERVRRVYVAAEMGAGFCRGGGADPARRLESLPQLGPKAAKEFFFDPKKIAEAKETMECGSLLAASISDPYQSYITFEDEANKPKHVVVMSMNIDQIPSRLGFTKYSFGSLKGYCRTDDEDRSPHPGELLPRKADGTCGETSTAAFVQGTKWFFGERGTLETVAARVAKPREDLNSGVAALKDASEQMEGLPMVRIQGSPKSSKEFLMSPCDWGAFQASSGLTTFQEGCFPAKTAERTLTEIDSKIRGAAYEFDGDYQKAGAIHGNIVFIARDASAAKSLEKDVREIVDDWKAHLEMNDAKLVKETKAHPYTHRQKKFAAIVDTYFAALHKMKVTRSGRAVTVAFREPLSGEDLEALKDADRTTERRREAVAEILDAVQANKAPPHAPLATLVGSSWATYLLGPAPDAAATAPKVALTAAECAMLQHSLPTVKYSDLPNVDAREAYFQQKYAVCATKPPEVPPAQRGCLFTFKSTAEYAKCVSFGLGTPSNEPPEADFERAKDR